MCVKNCRVEGEGSRNWRKRKSNQIIFFWEMKFFLHFIHVLVEDLPSRKFGETRGAPSYIFSSFHHQKGNFSISTLSKSFFLFSDAEINDNVKFFPRHFTYHMKKNQEKGLIFFSLRRKEIIALVYFDIDFNDDYSNQTSQIHPCWNIFHHQTNRQDSRMWLEGG